MRAINPYLEIYVWRKFSSFDPLMKHYKYTPLYYILTFLNV